LFFKSQKIESSNLRIITRTINIFEICRLSLFFIERYNPDPFSLPGFQDNGKFMLR
jgi:hypothetical protein